jgi:hypothetical protein
MKIYFMLFIYAIVFISCESTESEETPSKINQFSKITNDELPINSSNSYEFVGQAYQDILHNYYSDSILPTLNDSIIEKVNWKASTHVLFEDFVVADYNLIPESRINYIVSDSNTALNSIVSNLSLPSKEKDNFRVFISTVLFKVDNDLDYVDIYNYVIAYESEIQKSDQLTSSEKEYVLTVTSIIRHSIYAKKRRPKKNTDLDWYWLTANFTGAIEGAQHGKNHAILAALKTGIIENK